MKKLAYSIYDSKLGMYKGLTLVDREGEIIRSAEGILTQDNDISKYPDDFTICHVGEFNIDTGAFVPAQSIKTVVKFWELRSQLLEKELTSDAIPTQPL